MSQQGGGLEMGKMIEEQHVQVLQHDDDDEYVDKQPTLPNHDQSDCRLDPKNTAQASNSNRAARKSRRKVIL